MRGLKTYVLSALLVLGLTAPALAQTFSSVQVLNGSNSRPSYTFVDDSDTGFYLKSAGVIGIVVNGAEVGTITTGGVTMTGSGSLVTINQTQGTVAATSAAQTGTGSYQAMAGDLNVSGTPGHADGYLAGVMGNIITAAVTGSNNSNFAGVWGKYDVTGSNSSTRVKAGVAGEVGTGTSADCAVCAVLGGDAATTQGNAAFGVAHLNSAVSSRFSYGVDLQGAAIGSYQAPFYANAPIRLTSDVVIMPPRSGAPTDGTSGTGAGFAGPGSMYVNIANGKWYTNTNTKASPTWTVIGTQS